MIFEETDFIQAVKVGTSIQLVLKSYQRFLWIHDHQLGLTGASNHTPTVPSSEVSLSINFKVMFPLKSHVTHLLHPSKDSFLYSIHGNVVCRSSQSLSDTLLVWIEFPIPCWRCPCTSCHPRGTNIDLGWAHSLWWVQSDRTSYCIA